MKPNARDQIIRTISWTEAIDFLISRRAGRHGRTSAASVCHATLGLVPYVPLPLRHIGCMWLEEGDEAQRCNRPPTWTMGTTLEWPRLYCDEHARRILERRRHKTPPPTAASIPDTIGIAPRNGSPARVRVEDWWEGTGSDYAGP